MTPVNDDKVKNLEHNRKVNYHHIQDPYFKDKLNKGFIKYDPSEWIELTPYEERGLDQ